MKRSYMKRAGALLLAGALALEPLGFTEGGRGFFGGVTALADTWQGLVKATTLNVRSGPGTSYSAVDTLGNNTSVTVTGQTTGSDGQVWYQISYGNGKTGYARHDFIKQPTVYSASDANFEAWMNQQGFPESYKNDLRGLHQQYPNWIFTAQHTGLDWNTVIQEESKVGRNLVYKTSKSSWKSTQTGAFDWANNYWPGFDGAAWQAASSEIISYYMDPRNFLSEPYIYQFELQSYDASSQTREGLVNIVEGTFLAGDALVPLEGSQIEGGTVVEVAVDANGAISQGSASGSSQSGTGTSSGSGSSQSSSSSQSGGSSQGGGTSVVQGPGASSDNGFVNSGPGASGGSGSADGSVIIAGPTAAIDLSRLFSAAEELFQGLLSALTGSFEAYAGAWQQNSQGWWYQNDDGTYLTGWNWLDGNGDGTAECYYFYDNGYMAANTEIDGYLIDANGCWTSHDGVVYTQPASAVSGGSASGAVQMVKMKKVPYVDIIMKAAELSGVSPYVLASMIIQEQGVNGTSDLISGTSSTYPGYYNFFNIGAYAHDGMNAVTAGLQYASQSGDGGRPWNSIEKSIIGGAQAYGANYVQKGQDTFYLKKFNVQGSNKYNHQYMTNVPAAANEGAKVSEAYSQAVKATSLEFKIPVYENMPETACPMPSKDGNPNNKLQSIAVEGYTLTPSYQMDVQSYDLIVDSSVATVNIVAKTIDSNATVSGAGTVSLNTGLNTFTITVTAENGDQRQYIVNINRREGADGTAVPGGTGTTGPSSGTGSQPAGPASASEGTGAGQSPQPVPGGGTEGPSGNVIVIG